MKGNLIFQVLLLSWNSLGNLLGLEYCERNDQCQFHSVCVDDVCLCNADCSRYDFLLLCGTDGNYYVNNCYLAMASCEQQREIRVEKIGFSQNCSSHRFHSLKHSTKGVSAALSYYQPCRQSTGRCANFGICVQRTAGVEFCLCSSGFGGERCQNKIDIESLAYVAQPRAAVRSNCTDYNLIVLLTSSVSSALIFSFLTAALCYRYKRKNKSFNLTKPNQDILLEEVILKDRA